MTFGERLKKLRTDIGLKQSAVADALNISVQRISLYENGREPDYETLIKLAEYFGVLVDYLIGRTNYETIFEAREIERFSATLDAVLDYFEIDRDDENVIIERFSNKKFIVPKKDHERNREILEKLADALYEPYA